MASKAISKAESLLKCLCGCSELSKHDIGKILALSPSKFFTDDVANKLFHQYLSVTRDKRSDDESDTERYLEIYNICKQIIKNDIVTDADVTNLKGIKLRLRDDLAEKLQGIVDNNDVQIIVEIQKIYFDKIDISSEYTEFKEYLSKKL